MANVIDLLRSVEQLKDNVPDLDPGDMVKVHVRIIEGKNERVQVFQGLIIALGGQGSNAHITVRRTASNNIGVERRFLVHSPRIDKIEIVRRAKVRRAKLYYLRNRSGKSARLKERARR